MDDALFAIDRYDDFIAAAGESAGSMSRLSSLSSTRRILAIYTS